MLREARERFPGLTFESSTRHVGFGLVVEEARVRDVARRGRRRARGAEVDEAARAAEDEVRARDRTRCGTSPHAVAAPRTWCCGTSSVGSTCLCHRCR